MYQNNVEGQLVDANAVHFDEVWVVELLHDVHLFHKVLKVKILFFCDIVMRPKKSRSWVE